MLLPSTSMRIRHCCLSGNSAKSVLGATTPFNVPSATSRVSHGRVSTSCMKLVSNSHTSKYARSYSSGKDSSRFPGPKRNRNHKSTAPTMSKDPKDGHHHLEDAMHNVEKGKAHDPFMNSLPISAYPLAYPSESSLIPTRADHHSAPKILMNRKFMRPNPLHQLPRHRQHDLLNADAADSNADPQQAKRPRLWTPKEIRDFLNHHVIGQEQLKKTVSVAIYNHYKRLDVNTLSNEETDELDPFFVEKSNVLLIGPSGSGKTLIAKTVAKLLEVPFSMNDATPLTQAGYVGDDVESCIQRLLENADYDVARAETGIVFIDEIDKLSKRSDASNPSQRDVSGEGVQQALLRMLEGTMVNVTIKPGTMMQKNSVNSNPITVTIDTSNILFICSGAFVNLDRIIEERVTTKGSFGFGTHATTHKSQDSKSAAPSKNFLHAADADDLIKYGLIPEFVGRLPIIAYTDPLTIKDLVRVLTEPKNSLVRQYQKLFRQSGLELIFHQEALEEIAKIAASKKTGARGLRRIMETLLMEPLFDYPGSDIRYIVITPDTVRNSQHHALSFKDGQESDVCCAANLTEIPRPFVSQPEDIITEIERTQNVVFSSSQNDKSTNPRMQVLTLPPPKPFDVD